MSWKGHQALHTLLCPALRRLIHLTRVGPGSRSQLWEPLLERQFSLGGLHQYQFEAKKGHFDK